MPSGHSKKTLILDAAVALFLIGVAGCGVKGDPLPPLQQPAIGRGQPTYHKAAETLPLQNYSPVEDQEKDEKEPEDE